MRFEKRSTMSTILTLKYLKSVLHYDPLTGQFVCLVDRGRYGNSRKAGSIAGFILKGKNYKPYAFVKVLGFSYRAHRLAWFYMTGNWPKEQIDHINLNKSDNRWINLREATQKQNSANCPVKRTSKSGIKCVSQRGKKWRVKIGNRWLGTFSTAEEASAAYQKAAKEAFGEFART